MSRMENATFTNMCMIEDNKGNVLIQVSYHPDWPGITFPGGHVEKGESFVDSVIREVKEETGLDILHPKLCGIKQFQGVKDERYLVIMYKSKQFTGSLHSSEEGEVKWVPKCTLHEYELASGMKDMIRLFEDDMLSEFYYEKKDGEWTYSLR